MNIIINALTFGKNQQPGFYNLLIETLKRWLLINNHINFIVLSDKQQGIFSELKFAEVIAIDFNNKGFLKKEYVLNFALPKLIKEKDANLIINIQEAYIKSQVKQICLCDNIENTKELQKGISYNAKYLCFNKKTNDFLLNKFSISSEKISCFPKAIFFDENVINQETLQQVKDGYADGRNYFLLNLFQTNIAKIIFFLKAFSIFKKWQNSNMKLLLFNLDNELTLELNNLLASYKYRDDVVLINILKEDIFFNLIASSYCYIEINSNDEISHYIHQSVKYNVTVLTNDDNSINEIYKDNLWYCNSNSVDSISAAFKTVYKDEVSKAKKISSANQIQNLINRDLIYDSIWNEVSKLF